MAGPQPPQQLRQQEQKQWRQQAHVQEHSPGPSPLPFKKRLSRSPSPGGGWVGWRLSPAYWLGDEGGGDASSAEGDAEAMAAPKTQGPNEEGDDGGGDSHGEGSPPAPFGWLSGLIDSPTRPSGSDGGTADNAEPSAVPPTRVAADSDTDEGEDIICGQPLPEQTGTAAEASTGAGGEAEAVTGEDACAPPVCSFCGLEEGGEAGVFLLVEAGGESTKAKGKRATRKRKGRAKGPEPTLHAHVECALWAPNCFQGDGGAILGVRSEIQRAQRLKCFTCKSGGAALGCSVKKCRKSFHVPCGRMIGAHFDEETFTALCPDHAPAPAAGEASLKGKGKKRAADDAGLSPPAFATTKVVSTLASKRVGAMAPPGSRKAVVFAGASPAQVQELSALAEEAGFDVLEAWSAHATHLVAVGAAARKGSKQAAKGAMRIAAIAGMPIVTAEWLRACAETGFDLDEAPYSVA